MARIARIQTVAGRGTPWPSQRATAALSVRGREPSFSCR
jgi:hypothetical protein